MKDDQEIAQAIIKTRKEGKFDHHSLTISSMRESDYGNYSYSWNIIRLFISHNYRILRLLSHNFHKYLAVMTRP